MTRRGREETLSALSPTSHEVSDPMTIRDSKMKEGKSTLRHPLPRCIKGGKEARMGGIATICDN